MRYSVSDLDLFALLVDTGRLEGTAYFELHPTELPEPMACWLPGSLFVKDAAFDFFVTCFERANSKFDYFAFERFAPAQVDALLEQLSIFATELVPGCSREVLFSRYNSLFRANIWDDVGTDDLRSAVVLAASGISQFVRDSGAKARCLWVLGM